MHRAIQQDAPGSSGQVRFQLSNRKIMEHLFCQDLTESLLSAEAVTDCRATDVLLLYI